MQYRVTIQSRDVHSEEDVCGHVFKVEADNIHIAKKTALAKYDSMIMLSQFSDVEPVVTEVEFELEVGDPR